MKVVHDDDLNAHLAKIFSEAEEFITIVCPYIKLSTRTKDILKQVVREKPMIELRVIFGKNESSPNSSLKKYDLDFFIDSFNNIEILYKERLHAKCYINESMGMITSMNLYDYSQANNLELGVFFESKGVFNALLKHSVNAIEYLSNNKASSIESQIASYIDKIQGASKILFKKSAIVEESGFLGMSTKISGVKINEDNLDKFFNLKPIISSPSKTETKASIKKVIPKKTIVKTPLKKTSINKKDVKIKTKTTTSKPKK